MFSLLLEVIRYAGIQIVSTVVKAVLDFHVLSSSTSASCWHLDQFHIDLLDSATLLMLKNVLFHLKFAI